MLTSVFDQKGRIQGLERIHSGKVRDTYMLPGFPDLRLVVASDRISIFDFILNAIVKNKGEILTAMNVFWRQALPGLRHDLVAYGSAIDLYLPQIFRGDPEIQKRAVVVRSLKMIPVECIARGYLTGSGWSAYRKDGYICGHLLPPGLHDGSRFCDTPIFTPTTKAEVGHDEHMDFKVVRERFPDYDLEGRTLDIYCRAQKIAREKGVIIADTKFEFGTLGGGVLLADEVLTPDSSRFWDEDEYAAAQAGRKSPTPHDKQYVREYGKKIGIAELDPREEEDREWVRQQSIPQAILDQTAAIYHGIFARITGQALGDFQRNVMSISGWKS